MTTPMQPDEILLEQGQYWRALEDVPSQSVYKDEVLLLESIRDVDNKAHTIILRPHPERRNHMATFIEQRNGEPIEVTRQLIEHRFLTNDFVRLFRLEPNYEAIRRAELARIQARIVDLQNELALSESVPTPSLQKALSAGIEEWEKNNELPEGAAKEIRETKVTGLTIGLQPEDVTSMKLKADFDHKLATIKSDWLKGKTEEISETVQSMVPFFQETAAAAISKTEDIRRYVQRLQTGIESLDLYVGTGVHVTRIREGASAPPEEKLTIMQRKLFADEELTVFQEISEMFDHTNQPDFLKALATNQQLVDQICPTPRCVVAYAITRRSIDYKDLWTNLVRNKHNKKVGLIVRDGENLFVVLSPIDSHLFAHNLFPGKAEIDKIFERKGFWRMDKEGQQITFRDLDYTDALEEHEKTAVHYKRFLILLAGLDHRENLFGEFYPGPKSLAFASMRFQNEYLRFVHDADGEGLLPKPQLKPLRAWMQEKNAFLRDGSRVAAVWNAVLDRRTAPGVVREDSRGNEYYLGTPATRASVEVAFKDGPDISVSLQIKRNGYNNAKTDEFNARIKLTRERSSQPTFLVLDNVRSSEIAAYIMDRDQREVFLSYIELFKVALVLRRQEEQEEATPRQLLLDALEEGNIATGSAALEIVDKAVISWRALNKGAKLPASPASDPTGWKQLLDTMYTVAHSDVPVQKASEYAAEKGLQPLRVVVSGKNRLRLYCAPEMAMRDDRLEDHIWTRAFDFELRGKNAEFKVIRESWAELPASITEETTLHEWPEAADWAGLKRPYSFDRKQQMLARLDEFHARFEYYTNPANFDAILADWRFKRNQSRGGYVQNPRLAIPFGMVAIKGNGGRERYVYLVLTCENVYALLRDLAKGDAARTETIRKTYVTKYERSDLAQGRFVKETTKWSIMAASVFKFESNIDVDFEFSSIATSSSIRRHTDSFNYLLADSIREWATRGWNQGCVYIPRYIDFDTLLGIDARVKTVGVEYRDLRGVTDESVIRELNGDVETKEASVVRLVQLDEDGNEPKTVPDDRDTIPRAIVGYSSTGIDQLFFTYEDAVAKLETEYERITEGRFATKSPGVERWRPKKKISTEN
jgi:hypothetical protein